MRGRSLLCVSVGVCLVALFVAGCGEDSTRGASSGSTTSTVTVTTSASTTSTSTTSTTVSTETATTTFFAPDCDHGTQLASVAPDGGGVAFVETTDHRFLCVVGGAGRPLAVGLVSGPPVVTESQFAGFGSMLSGRGGGAIYLFLLPARPDDPVIVRDEAGKTVIYVLTTSGRQLAVFEPQSGDMTLPQPFGRTWKIVDPDGTVLATLATPAAPSQSGPIPPATTTSPESVVTSVATATVPSSVPSGSGYDDRETPQCLFEHGLSAADPQPYSPAVAMPAWQACRDLMIKGMERAGMPADAIARQMAFWDCMAEQGWIWLQPSARDASAKCGRA